MPRTKHPHGPEPEGRPLRRLIRAFRVYLHFDDPAPIYIPSATIIANRQPGTPLWIMLVGPPSYAKTVLICSVAHLPGTCMVADVTKAGFLSGSSRKDVVVGATGGLLLRATEGCLLFKDFTSVLSMRRDQRAEVLGVFREIYDGEWSRDLGPDGGKHVTWKGKLGLLAGVTEAIDSAHAAMAVMGERFLLLRFAYVDGEVQAEKALSQPDPAIVQRELQAATTRFFAEIKDDPSEDIDITEDDRRRLIAISAFIAHARAPVIRDDYSKEITLIPGAESPARLAKVFGQFFQALLIMGTGRSEAWRVIQQAALDCTPSPRREILRAVCGGDPEHGLSVEELDRVTKYSTATVRRAIEDLEIHDMFRKKERPGEQSGKRVREHYLLTWKARNRYSRGFRPIEKEEEEE